MVKYFNDKDTAIKERNKLGANYRIRKEKGRFGVFIPKKIRGKK